MLFKNVEVMRKILAVTPLLFMGIAPLIAQNTGRVSGKVQDVSCAVLPGARVTLMREGSAVEDTTSKGDGSFTFVGLPFASYDLHVEANGFAAYSFAGITVNDVVGRQLTVTLRVATEEQLTVTTQTAGVSLDSDQNVDSTVLKGSDLNALSDDPDTLRTQLQALAGPAAGTNGGQIYIDGYTGGQLPPKSSILEVHVNQNPFSAEYDRIGYGRIDIVTRPGAAKFGGHLVGSYLNSALNTANPLASVQPGYQYYSFSADVTGPIAKKFSYFAAGQYWQRQNQNFLRAIDPSDLSANPRTLNQALLAPYSTANSFVRIDGQVGKHILQAQWTFLRTRRTGAGTGGLSLQEQGYSLSDTTNMLQLRDTFILSPRMLNEVSARWTRERTDQLPNSTRPSVTVQGAFLSGGNTIGRLINHQDDLEVHEYLTLTRGAHVLRAGGLARSYRIADYSNAGSNGSYLFQSLSDFRAALPYQYNATVVRNPLARLLQFDGALFVQDEWRARPNLNVSAGLRLEGQNRVHDHLNWAPRLALAWSPGSGKGTPKTVLKAAGGIFYNRFPAAQQLLTIHNNGSFQQSYVLNQPAVFDPDAPLPAALLTASPTSKPYVYTLDPGFRIARDVQMSFGIDRSFGKVELLNVSYLYTRGIHQYYANNVNAPYFDPVTYSISNSAPAVYDYQLQSGGDYRQHQFLVTSNTSYRKLTLHAVYTFNHAMTDVQGLNYFPSVAHNPSLDYGRATFTAPHQLQAFATYALPWKMSVSALAFAEAGRPYNITIGNDLTGNNQSNARPTFGTCGAANVASTKFGCLDTVPTGKGERIVPYGLGTGPANETVYLTLNRTFRFGPKASPALQPAAPRYALTVLAGATNIFNAANLGAPNGVLLSPLFGQQSNPPTGTFALSSPGNRTVYFTSYFTF